jgi:outer membrane protein assembly factor BamE (lipoprotein component of BamABCDE complex)
MLKKLVLSSLVVAFFGSFIGGCVSTLGRQIDQSGYSQIKKGVSTKEDVVELLGSPNNEIENDDGTSTFMYQYTKVSSGIYGIGAGMDSQSATIKFNSKGIVISKSKTIGDTGGTGLGGGGVK